MLSRGRDGIIAGRGRREENRECEGMPGMR